MKVNYVLMYGTPYLKYREFETFEEVSKFLVNKRIVNYSIFKKLEDKEEVEMIYRDIDIHYLETIINKAIETLSEWTIFETSACTDRIISETLDILKGVDKEVNKEEIFNRDLEISEYKEEIERLNNILIEIKEIINNKYWFNWEFENDEVIKEVLEIISKEEVRK